MLSGAVPADELVAMKLNALVVDLSLLGADGWDFLERVCGDAARPRASSSAPSSRPSRSASVDCGSAPTTGSPSPRTPRRWRRGSRPWSGGASAASRRPTPARSSQARSRSARTSSRRSSRAAASTSPAASSSCSRSSSTTAARSSSARTSTSGSGDTRWPTATAPSTSSSASSAPSSRKHSPGWAYIHTHFGVGYRFEPEAIAGDADLEARTAAAEAAERPDASLDRPTPSRIYPARVGSPACSQAFHRSRHKPVTGTAQVAATLLPNASRDQRGGDLRCPDSKRENPVNKTKTLLAVGARRRARAGRCRLRRRRRRQRRRELEYAATSRAPSRSTARAPSSRSPRPRSSSSPRRTPDFDGTVGAAGTGGGFEKFCAGETDISDASRPIEPEEEVRSARRTGSSTPRSRSPTTASPSSPTRPWRSRA